GVLLTRQLGPSFPMRRATGSRPAPSLPNRLRRRGEWRTVTATGHRHRTRWGRHVLELEPSPGRPCGAPAREPHRRPVAASRRGGGRVLAFPRRMILVGPATRGEGAWLTSSFPSICNFSACPR